MARTSDGHITESVKYTKIGSYSRCFHRGLPECEATLSRQTSREGYFSKMAQPVLEAHGHERAWHLETCEWFIGQRTGFIRGQVLVSKEQG